MDKPDFVYVSYIQTTPEKLWQALTTSEFTRQFWGGHTVECEWRVGAPIVLRKPDGTVGVTGEILVCDQPRVLSYSWDSARFKNPALGLDPEPPSRVTFELSPQGEVVKLTCTHTGFAPGSKLLPLIGQGWPAILSNLKSLLETGRPLAFPPWRE